MKTVQPIRDVKTINQVKELLKVRHDKYYMMFVLGVGKCQVSCHCFSFFLLF